MKKKILSVILCAVMLASVFTVISSASVDLEAANATWSDDSCLKLTRLQWSNASHKFTYKFPTVAESNTMTFYFMPDETTATTQNCFPFVLLGSGGTVVSVGARRNASQTVNGVECYGSNVYCDYTSVFDGAKSVTNLEIGKWNRIDILINYDNDAADLYVNYNRVGGLALNNKETGYNTMEIPNASMSNNTKIAYMDSLMIRKGAHTPVKGDLASNLDVHSVVSGKDGVLYFDSFDTWTSGYTNAGEIYHPGGASSIAVVGGGIAKQNGAMNRGYQQSVAVADTQDANKKIYNTRFVATLDDYTKYDEIGFKLTVNGKETYVPCNKVYDSVTGGFEITNTYSALGTYGAGYIYCLTVTGMEEGTSYAIEVAPYTVAKGETQKTVAASYTVTLTAGATAQ